jgi:hypothetical protein
MSQGENFFEQASRLTSVQPAGSADLGAYEGRTCAFQEQAGSAQPSDEHPPHRKYLPPLYTSERFSTLNATSIEVAVAVLGFRRPRCSATAARVVWSIQSAPESHSRRMCFQGVAFLSV